MNRSELTLADLENSLIRERIEQNQNSGLSEFACRPTDSTGRPQFEEEDPLRTCFQLDRDRILYSRAFRRLKFKTQVFIEPVNDDTRTRLTHTLEVMQISRTVARTLSLNEDLTEAIALGHDIGHTPFAHSGESVLDELSDEGFHHSNQSLRVVDRLADNGEGLNLTHEVRNGIVSHSKTEESMFKPISGSEPGTLEGSVVRTCDSVAYLNHDIDDAIQAGVLDVGDLPGEALDVLGNYGGERIDRTVKDIILSSHGKDEVRMSSGVREANDRLRSFMFDNVYHVLGEKPIAREARRVIRELYEYFSENISLVYELCPFLETVRSFDPVIDFLSLQSDMTTLDLYRRHLDGPLEYLTGSSY